MFIDTTTHEYPVSRDDIAAAKYPAIVPMHILPEQAVELGYAPVQPTAPPEQIGHEAVEQPPALIEGQWVQQWALVELPVVPEPVPEVVPALNGMLALDAAGLSAAFDAWANDSERTFAERAFLQRASTWRRDNVVLIAGATALGVSAEQMDDLFRAAAALQV